MVAKGILEGVYECFREVLAARRQSGQLRQCVLCYCCCLEKKKLKDKRMLNLIDLNFVSYFYLQGCPESF